MTIPQCEHVTQVWRIHILNVSSYITFDLATLKQNLLDSELIGALNISEFREDKND